MLAIINNTRTIVGYFDWSVIAESTATRKFLNMDSKFSNIRKFIDCIYPVNNRVDQDPNSAATDVHGGRPVNNTAVIDLPVEYHETLNPNIMLDIPPADSINNFFEQTNSNFNVGASNCSVNSRLAAKRRIRRSLFHVWDSHLAMKLFGSKKKIIEELERQENINHWVIHPCSKFR